MIKLPRVFLIFEDWFISTVIKLTIRNKVFHKKPCDRGTDLLTYFIKRKNMFSALKVYNTRTINIIDIKNWKKKLNKKWIFT